MAAAVPAAAFVLATHGCEGHEPGALGGDAETRAATTSEDASTGGSSDARPALRDRARAALVDGTLPAPLRAELLASTDPELAAARRLFRTMETDDARQAPAATPSSPTSPPSAAVAPTPDPGAATTGAPAESASAPTLAVAPTSPGVPAVAADRESSPEARLVLLTKLELRPSKGGGATLELRASSRPRVSLVSQAGRGRAIYMISSAGALPAVRQARPEAGGVRVVQVRRGDSTVQITVEMEEGLVAREPTVTDAGASVRFAPPAGGRN